MRRRAGHALALLALRLYYLPALVLSLADTVAGQDTLAAWLDEERAPELEEAVA